jgi:hypothetical protein
MNPGDRNETRDALDAVVTLGGPFMQEGPDEEERFRSIRERVRDAVAIPAQPSSSVAVVDRTSLWRTTQLLAGERGSGDPFIALADLATILGAAIFDDRIVVLGSDEIINIAASASELLGLDDVIHPIPFNPNPQTNTRQDWELSYLSEKLLFSALAELSRASEHDAEWIGSLRAKWREFLPELNDFPSYDYYRLVDLYDKYENYDVYDLFNIVGGEWKFSFEDPAELILDNDLRGLFYERLVQCLSIMLTQAGTGPSVRYVGGCLRAPMLLARAELARTPSHETVAPSGWLQRGWTDSDSMSGGSRLRGMNPIVLPFWADAVISACERPEDFKRVVRRYRERARAFRKRRGEIDLAIQEGNMNELEKLGRALQGDVSSFSSDIVAAGGQTLENAIPLVTGFPVPGIALATGSIAKLLPRYIFRPHLRLLMSLSKNARSLTRPLHRTVRIFNYPQARDADPGRFLKQLGRIAWLT